MTRYREEHAERPGRVARVLGVIFQSDERSSVGRMFIRPMEELDRMIAGLHPQGASTSLAMHAGLHVRLEDGREYVAEQLVGTPYMDLKSGLNWTPVQEFRQRDRAGWDVTVPVTRFRGIEEDDVAATVGRLNQIEGRPFVGEDCTAFVERAFAGKRLFADSPLLQSLGVPARVGDPALPLLRPDVRFDERTRHLLRTDAVQQLPDPERSAGAPNAWLWLRRLAPALALGALLGWLLAHVRVRR
ncbi:MAG: hypothetical protein JO023_09340 [Chloroflexi bacterium]|nr:hypothetical protein [Chloroflexota bacterium]